MVPVRTCVGCRRRAPQDQLVRLALTGAGDGVDGAASDQGLPQVVPDVARRAPGRGCWLHPEPGCLEQALSRKAFHRAFRRQVDTSDLSPVGFQEVLIRRGKRDQRDGYPMSTDG